MARELNMAEANKKIKNETETYEKLTKIFTKIKEAEEKAGKTRKECFDHFSVMTKIKEDDNEILKDLYKSFGKSMKELEDARDKHLEKIKGLIIPITQYYPTELKKNKNNLEKIAKAKKETENLKKSQAAATELRKSHNNEAKNIEDFETMFLNIEKNRVNDDKCIISHFIHSELKYHCAAIQKLSELFSHINKTNVNTGLVKFADDSIVLSSGLKPIYNPKNKYKYADGLSFDDEQELNHEMERSLRHRINMSIKENNDQVELLEEMPSYVEQERISKEEAEAKRVKDDYKIDIDNLYYGTEQYGSEAGAIGFSMTLVSWFEYMNMDIMNYHVFRSVPLGDICLIDNNGKIHIPEEIMSKGNVEVGPNTPIRGVKIMSIINIVKEGLKKAEAADDEMSILELKGIIEHLEDKEKIKVSELGIYESTIRNLFEQTQGNIFSDDGKDVEVEKDDDNENTHHI